jgi:hypothetical protein
MLWPSAVAAAIAVTPAEVAGILIHHVGPVDEPTQRSDFGEGRLGVVGEAGVDLERDPSLDS